MIRDQIQTLKEELGSLVLEIDQQALLLTIVFGLDSSFKL